MRRTQRFAGQRRHHGRVNAAGQTKQGAGESVLARVVANAEHQRLAHRLGIVARQTARVGHATVEIDCADELFERWRLQNDLAITIGDDAGSVKDYAVVSAGQIYEDYGQTRGPVAIRNHLASPAHLAFVEWRNVAR